METCQLATFRSLKRIHDMIEPDTEDHAVRTGEFAIEIAKRLAGKGSYAKLDDEQMELLFYSVQIHDFGKIFISPSVINKPNVLNKAERTMMERHSVLGMDSIELFNLPQVTREVVSYHHEHYDGSGYPRGLRGREIPIHARIACIADVWDAINSDRVYRPAMSNAKAIRFMQEHKHWFDPKLFSIFLSIVKPEHGTR